MTSFFSWFKIIIVFLFSIFFLLFGVETLMGAFQVKNPLEFIMYFFSASFVILVSLVGIIYTVSQTYSRFKSGKKA